MIDDLQLEGATPVASNWLKLSGQYEGRGTAEFSNPRGTIEGDVKVSFDESGELEIVMTVYKINSPDRTLRFGLDEFLSGEVPVPNPNGKGYTMGINLDFKNPCESLVVQTVEGNKFWAKGKILCWTRELSLTGQDEGRTISFKPLRPIYDSMGSDAPEYWVIPLFNYLSDFCFRSDQLNDHALRIFQTPNIPTGLPEAESTILKFRANERNHLTIFTFNGGQGFVEALADYDERKEKLLTGKVQRTVTSVMVGRVGGRSVDFADLEQWFPFDYLLVLGFATGIQIGAPWIEFRTKEGNLVRRVHVDLGKPVYFSGIASINELIHQGTGTLLSLAENNPHWAKSYFRVALKQLLLSSSHALSIEDQMSHLFRALDVLCQEFVQRRAIQNPDLTQSSTQAVAAVITQGISELKSYRLVNKIQSSTAEGRALDRIEEKIKNATKTEVGFGKAVLSLLKQPEFDLPDGDVLLKYGQSRPWPGKRGWTDVLSRYRGIVMHQGYFDFRTGDEDILEIFRVMLHLHDIVVRMILKMLGYQSTYQPSVLQVASQIPVNWVKPDTPARKLGYLG
jgi:hypothetical protein